MKTVLLIPLCAIASLTLLAGCDSAPPPAPAAAAAAAPPFHVALNVKQVMNWIIDPSADELWDSVGTIITAEGREEIQPRTDEEWNEVRNHAAVLVESGNLLMMQGRAFDADEWMKVSRGLTDAATTALQAAEAKDVEALFDAGGEVYQACVACHEKYALPLQEQGR